MHRQQRRCNIKTETTCSSSYKRMSKGKHKCKGKRMSKGKGEGKCQRRSQGKHPCYVLKTVRKKLQIDAPLTSHPPLYFY